jgi:hypothetical protein
MKTIRLPGFTAEASFTESGAPYRGGAMLAGLQQAGEVLVRPAMKILCGDEMCCLSRIPGMPGFGAICCPISGKGDCEFVFS